VSASISAVFVYKSFKMGAQLTDCRTVICDPPHTHTHTHPYSTDLAPLDCHMFGPLKETLHLPLMTKLRKWCICVFIHNQLPSHFWTTSHCAKEKGVIMLGKNALYISCSLLYVK